MTISDLRYDLKQVAELRGLDIDLLPDAMVAVVHDQLSTIYHDDVPQWLVSTVTTWVALEKNAVKDYEDTIRQKDAIISELRARLGYDVDMNSSYAEAGD